MRRQLVRIFASSVAVLALAHAAPSQADIISAAGAYTGGGMNPVVQVDKVSTTAGDAVAYKSADFDTRAMTDYGINRIYNSASATTNGESYATSAWSQTFTAQGSGMVDLKFSFTIDGSVAYGLATHMRSFNYLVTALKGDWSLGTLDGYDDIVATTPWTVSTVAFGQMRSFNGIRTLGLDTPSNSIASQGTSADGYQFRNNVTRDGPNVIVDADVYNPANGQDQHNLTFYYPDGFQQAPGPVIPYTAVPQAKTAYENLLANFPILAQSGLCSAYSQANNYEGCAPGIYEPTTLTLEFSLAAGTSFTLVSALMSQNAQSGTVDFYNTVRLTDIVATGGTIASDNPQFQSLGDGRYGFAAAPVPEPATWALLIGGFGAIGTTMRRRRMAVA